MTNEIILSVSSLCLAAWLAMVTARNWLGRRVARLDALSVILDDHNKCLEALIEAPEASDVLLRSAALISEWSSKKRSAEWVLEAIAEVASDMRQAKEETSKGTSESRETSVLWLRAVSSAIDLASLVATGGLARSAAIHRALAGYEDLEQPAITRMTMRRPFGYSDMQAA